MAQECARQVLQEMMHQELTSQPSLEDPKCPESWLAWTRRKPMLEMKLKPREVSWSSNTPLSMVSSQTGMIWRRSGTTASSMNWEFPRKNILACWLRPPWTPRPTEKRWLRSCSKPSMFPHSMLLSKPSCPSMPQEEPQVSSSTPVMVSPTPSPSMKVMPYPMPSWELT